MSEGAFCPKCRFAQMVEKDSGFGFMVDECPECGGRWYDAGELQTRVREKEKFQQALSQGMIGPRESERVCPRCEQHFVNGGLINQFLRVDFCQKCQGFWLDKNEIPLVDKLLE